MLVADVMTRRVVSTRPDAGIDEAIRLMLRHRISGLPVVDAGGTLVGIVTEGDFLRRGELGTERRRPRWLEFLLGPGRLAEDYAHSHGRRVEAVMTRDVVAVAESTSLDRAVEIMERHGIKRLPVTRGARVVGIVSRANLLHALARLAARPAPAGADDAALRERVYAEIEKQPWAPPTSLNVIVADGVVDLWGVVTDDRQRRAMAVAAEAVPGVKQVRSHLALLEPYTGTVLEPEEEAGPTAAAR